MSFKKSLIIVLIAELLIALLAVNNYGLTLEGLQATTRFSGRLSLLLFSIIFLVAAFDREKLSSFLSPKPFLVFAIAHGIHLAELLSYVYLSEADLIPIRLAGGFVAYVFIFIMPLLHSRYWAGSLEPKKYALAEHVYMYYVWFIFFMSYLPRVQGKLPNAGGSYPEFVTLLFWVCIMLLAKIYSHLFLKKVTI